MVGRVVRFLVAWGAEILLAVGLVLSFFLVFMWILGRSVPRGTSLLDLMRSGDSRGEETSGGPGQIDSGTGGSGDDAREAVARLSRIHRDVKDKAAAAIAWTASREGMSLGDYHAVQTFDRSGATITFSESGEMTLGENTLVVLKRSEPLTSRNRRLASLIVVGGELHGTIASSRDAPVSMEIVAASKSVRVLSGAGPLAPAEFSVRVDEGASSTFTVFKGSAEVTSEQGTLIVAPNQAVTVDRTGSLGAPREIPPPPVLLEPEQGARLTFRASRSRMHFAWSGAGENDLYALAVARDPEFRDVVDSELLLTPEFILGNLRAGTYYWRVGTRRGDLEGPYGAARQFRITRELREPSLEVAFPGRVVTTPQIVVAGFAQPGARVFVNNEEAPIDPSGRFSRVVTLQRGVNMVVVEAIDAAGNVAYRSETIDARY